MNCQEFDLIERIVVKESPRIIAFMGLRQGAEFQNGFLFLAFPMAPSPCFGHLHLHNSANFCLRSPLYRLRTAALLVEGWQDVISFWKAQLS